LRFHILTLFPEIFQPFLETSIIGRSIQEKKICVELINFRDFATDKHHKVDDATYGGGPGMVLKCEPIHRAIESVRTNHQKIVFLTPQGQLFNQQKAIELSDLNNIILVCGHYEGFDHRIFQLFDHEKLSIGDYILTGGEVAALVVVDAVIRLREEVLNNSDSLSEESLNNGLLEYNQYTRPVDYENLLVPDVLISGHHKKIDEFRRQSSLINTLKNRADLFEKLTLTHEDIDLLIAYLEEKKDDYK